MIQRIQSVFLVLVMAGMIAYLFLPFWEKLDPATGNQVLFTPIMLKMQAAPGNDEVITYFPYLICGIGAVLAVIIGAIEILSFKNRMTQIKLGLVNSIIMSLVLFYSAWLALQAQKNFLPEIKGVFKLGLFAPVFSMIFNSLANRFIKRDEDKVRAANRIR